MKKIFILIITGIVFSNLLKAQTLKNDIFTPKGSPVVTYQMTEASNYDREYYDADLMSRFPNAKPIYTYPPYSSTRLFNCHGYAWLRVEGGPDRWIGLNTGNRDPDIYMTDSSYVEVLNAVYPGKVFYTRPGDHSAVTTATSSDTVISKWNEWPLMKHKLGYGPNFGSSWKFYIKTPTITGSKNICAGSSYTFSVINAPNGFVWDVSPSLTKTGTGTSITVTANGNEIPGWVRVMLGSIELARYDLWVGLPSPYIYFSVQGPFYSEDKYVYDYIEAYVTDLITLYPEYPKFVGALGFEIANNTGPTIKLFSPDGLSFKTPGSIGYTFSFDFRYKNACGWSDWWKITVVNTKYYDSRAPENGNGWIAYPNPASSVLNIDLSAETTLNGQSVSQETEMAVSSQPTAKATASYAIKLYDEHGRQQRHTTAKKGDKVHFNVSHLKSGIYYLHIYDGVHEKPEIHQIIVSHK